MYGNDLKNNTQHRFILKTAVFRFMKLGFIGITLALIANHLLNQSDEARCALAVTGEATKIPGLPENDRQIMAV